MTHGPIEQKHREKMNSIAKSLDHALNGKVRPKKFAFMLLVCDFDSAGGRMNYICNADRKNMIVAMKEFIANAEGRVPTTTETKQ